MSALSKLMQVLIYKKWQIFFGALQKCNKESNGFKYVHLFKN